MSEARSARCRACGKELAARQRWCLGCGAGTLTQIASAPRWAPTAAALMLVAALALVGIGYAVATLLSS